MELKSQGVVESEDEEEDVDGDAEEEEKDVEEVDCKEKCIVEKRSENFDVEQE